MLSRIVLFLGVILLIPLFALNGWGQSNTSRLDGVITDPSGGIISAAHITLIDAETGFTNTNGTNNNGLYVFPQVPAGKYTIQVGKKGFQTAVVNNVRIDVGVPLTVNVCLAVGEISEKVEVSAKPAETIMNTVSAEINTFVDRQQILSLPLAGQNPLDFGLLQAGVTGRDETRSASVNGLRGSYQNLTLDGINIQDNFARTDSFFSILPVRDNFVEEFSIVTANPDVDAGIGAGQISMITRSGSNDYHGEAFYVHRNSALNANEFFNNAAGVPRNRILKHQYGINTGGPVVKNKLFFFANWEEERDRNSISVVRRVLTESARRGLFAYQRSDSGAQETMNLLSLTGVPVDPIVSGLLAQTPFPNNNSVGDGINTGGYRFNSPANITTKWFSFKLDYKPVANHTLSLVLHQNRGDMPNDPLNGSDIRFPGLTGGRGQKVTGYLGSISLRSTLNSNLFNEIRFGAQSVAAEFYTKEQFKNGYQLKFPIVDNPVQNLLPEGRYAPVFELANNLIWVRGNHSFKFGGGIHWTKLDNYNNNGSLPLYTLGFGSGNQNPLQMSMFPGIGQDGGDFSRASDQLALLGGYVDQADQVFNVKDRHSGFVAGQGGSWKFSQRFFDLYAGDTWRLNQRLSLNLGLRWEYHGIPNETRGLSLFPEKGDADVFNANAIINFAGNGTGRNFYNRDWNNFAPSVGAAWRPFSKHSMVVRAGYSIQYVNDSNFSAVYNAVLGNDGLRQPVTVSGISGTVSGSGIVPISIPTLQVPRTLRDSILIDSFSALYAIDRNLRTPYVQQWTLSLQHEIFNDTTLEVRYVGNHGAKLIRAIDRNQLMLPADFLADFRNARTNLLANGDPYAGTPLTIIPKLGDPLSGVGCGPGLLNCLIGVLLTNEAGMYVGDYLAPLRNYMFSGEGGESFGATLPVSYFYRNPNSYASDVLGNYSYSDYHALQAELRRRSAKGVSFQINYTFGKVLTDFGGSQANFNAYLDNAQPQLEKMRADFDITHTINGNFTYDLPFGRNQRFGVQSPWLNAVWGGWKVSGIVRLHSGEVINIVSQRATLNRSARSGKNTVDLVGISVADLKARTGVHRQPDGRILMFDPSLVVGDGTANSQYFANPDLGRTGSLGLSPVSGPWYFNTDLALRKFFDIPFRDKSTLEISASFSNLFNHTNFDVDSTPDAVASDISVYNAQSINSTSFGLINKTFSPRRIQVGLRLHF
jgi:hypothetical protein